MVMSVSFPAHTVSGRTNHNRLGHLTNQSRVGSWEGGVYIIHHRTDSDTVRKEVMLQCVL